MAVIGTFGSFTAARLGIYSSQSAMNLVGNNISNINTKGYTRQRLDISSLYNTGDPRYANGYNLNIGYGALANQVSQLRDPYLDIRYRNENASLGAAEATLNCLDQISLMLDEVGKGTIEKTKDFGVIEAQFNDFVSRLKDVMNLVGQDTYDDLLRGSADTLCKLFNSVSKGLEDVRNNEVGYLEDTVKSVNSCLTRIRDLNEQIRTHEIYGDNALELRDARNLAIDELSKYMKIDVTYSKEKIDQYTEVEKLTITLPGTFDPDENSKNYGKEIKLIDGIYGTQVNVKKVYTENPEYDAALHQPYLDADGKPTSVEIDPDTNQPNAQNPAYYQYVSVDGTTLTNETKTKNEINDLYQGVYQKGNGWTDSYAEADRRPVKNPIYSKSEDPNDPNYDVNFKKYTYGFIDEKGNYVKTAGQNTRPNPFRQGEYLSADGKEYIDLTAAELANPDPKKVKLEPIPNPRREDPAYDKATPKYKVPGTTKTTNEEYTYHTKNLDFVGKYLTADGGSTDNTENADYVYDEKYLLELDTLKDKRDKVLRGAKDGGELTDITRLTDTDTSGALQAIREMLTEEGVFASADDLGQNLGKDPDRTAYETLIADPDANKKKGIPYYQKVLDNLAQIFAQTMNEANQIPLDKAAQAYQQGTLTNAGAGGNVTASGFLTADGKSIITKDGKELEQPDGGNALTAKDLELPENPTQADIDRVNGYLKQLRANGKLTPEYEFYNGGILFSNHSDSDDPTGITAANLSVAHKWALGEVRILQSVEPEYIDADGNKHEHTTANDNIAHMITLMNQQMNFLAKGYDDPKTQTDSVSDQPFFKGTFQEMFTNISGTLAHDTEINTALYTNYNLNALNLDNDRSSVSGVDLNEEATSIMQFQKSFAAACQLLTTIDSMLDKLINGTL